MGATTPQHLRNRSLQSVVGGYISIPSHSSPRAIGGCGRWCGCFEPAQASSGSSALQLTGAIHTHEHIPLCYCLYAPNVATVSTQSRSLKTPLSRSTVLAATRHTQQLPASPHHTPSPSRARLDRRGPHRHARSCTFHGGPSKTLLHRLLLLLPLSLAAAVAAGRSVIPWCCWLLLLLLLYGLSCCYALLE